MGKFCDGLKSAWSLVPQMRLGQFLWGVLKLMEEDDDDPFYDDDETFIKRLIYVAQGMHNHSVF